MSQDLFIKLRNKKHKENNIKPIELLYLSTTPAREFDSLGIFVFTTEDTIIPKDELNGVISVIKDELDGIKQNYQKSLETLQEYKEYLVSAQNEKIFDKIRDDINYTKRYQADIKEDIEEWQFYYDRMMFIREIANDNSEDWELVYTNC